jgi:hypothetical protein
MRSAISAASLAAITAKAKRATTSFAVKNALDFFN